MKLLQLILAVGLIGCCSLKVATAQEPPESVVDPAGQAPPADFMDGLGDFGGLGGFLDDGGGSELTLSGQLKIEEGSRDGILEVRAELVPPWHLYAMDQEGGPGPAKIVVNSPDAIQLTGPFRADREPEVREVEYFEAPLREHYEEVIWSAPVRLVEGVDPEEVQLDVQFEGQICSDAAGCKPMSGEPIPIVFGGYLEAGPAVEDMPVDETVTEAPAEAPSGPTTEQGPATEQEPAASGYRAARSFATIRGQIQSASVPPGGKLTLTLTADCDPTWHVYAYAAFDPQLIAKPTLIAVSEPSSWTVGPVQSSSTPTIKQSEPNTPPVQYHSGTVTWTTEIDVPESTAPGEYELKGTIGYQTCTDKSCDRPRAAQFTASVTVGDTIKDQINSLQFVEASYGTAAELALAKVGASDPASAVDSTEDSPLTTPPDVTPLADTDPEAPSQPVTDSGAETSLAAALAYAFLGGLILNIMPCVLPVIGLKIMTFVQQSGESRGKILALNIWYSLGLIFVFLVLATILAIWNVGWGQQFGNELFAITMAAIVFAMGLSFLGVWEIPIPGFVGGNAANELATKEGPAGAFFKGAITTILATPCSGPGIAIALGYCTGKPIGFVYLIFTMLGLGMASPYLIIGANPKLIRFLPKPGVWMETFKQIMGFVLMATVIYLLSFINWVNILPTIMLLLGLSGALWWIGRTSIAAEFQVKLRAWLAGAAFACVMGLAAFGGKMTLGSYELVGLQNVMQHRLDKFVVLQVDEFITQQGPQDGVSDPLLASPDLTQHADGIHWVPFTERRLQHLIDENRTVMIDFTADWCLTCKALETTVLNTQEVKDSLSENGVVTLLADWTNYPPEISRVLESLAGSKQVPVLAIFPAGRPEGRTVLLGGYTKGKVLEILQEAGPSQAVDSLDQLTDSGS